MGDRKCNRCVSCFGLCNVCKGDLCKETGKLYFVRYIKVDYPFRIPVPSPLALTHTLSTISRCSLNVYKALTLYKNMALGKYFNIPLFKILPFVKWITFITTECCHKESFLQFSMLCIDTTQHFSYFLKLTLLCFSLFIIYHLAPQGIRINQHMGASPNHTS